MKKETFPFKTDLLLFDKEAHEYTLNGKKMLSVTTWLSSFEPPFNPYDVSKKVSKLPNSEYYGMDPKVIRELWNKTGPRGSKKHDSIEKWLTGENESCKEQKFIEKLGINPDNTWSEIKLYSEKLLLAGTADIITRIDDNVFKIFDIKTSSKIGKEKLNKFSKQIFTYGLLLKHISDRPIRIIPGGIISIPPTDSISEGVTDEFNDPKYINHNKEVWPDFLDMVKHRKNQIL